jgi:hypothetical protein
LEAPTAVVVDHRLDQEQRIVVTEHGGQPSQGFDPRVRDDQAAREPHRQRPFENIERCGQ